MSQNILFVDDDPTVRFWASKLLNKAGYNFTTVENGRLALTFLENNSVDLIILDVRMPVLDGLESAQRIRQMREYAKVPIIGLSAESSKELCIQSGMNDYLRKPVSMSEFFRTLRHWLG